jgi:hypothetical protein
LEAAEKAAKSTQTNWRNSSEKIPLAATSLIFPTFKDWNAASSGGHAQTIDVDPARDESTPFSVHATSYPGAPHPSYPPPYGPAVSSNYPPHGTSSGNSGLPPLSNHSINLQNLYLAKKVSCEPRCTRETLATSIQTVALNATQPLNIEENRVANSVYAIPSQEQSGRKSRASLDAVDKRTITT